MPVVRVCRFEPELNGQFTALRSGFPDPCGNPVYTLLSGRCGVSPQKGSAETIGSAAGESLPLRLPYSGLAMAFQGVASFLKMRWKGYYVPY